MARAQAFSCHGCAPTCTRRVSSPRYRHPGHQVPKILCVFALLRLYVKKRNVWLAASRLVPYAYDTHQQNLCAFALKKERSSVPYKGTSSLIPRSCATSGNTASARTGSKRVADSSVLTPGRFCAERTHALTQVAAPRRSKCGKGAPQQRQ